MTSPLLADDQLDIAALLYRYARAVDSKDWALYRSVFTEDAVIDYSSAGAICGTRDEVADWLATGFTAIPMSMHYITNIEILECGGDSAPVRAMFYNPMQLSGMSDLSSHFRHHQSASWVLHPYNANPMLSPAPSGHCAGGAIRPRLSEHHPIGWRLAIAMPR